MGWTTTFLACGAAALLAVAGCDGGSSAGVTGADAAANAMDAATETPDAKSDGAADAPDSQTCLAVSGQCEVGAVCEFTTAGTCGSGPAICCLHVICAADATVQLIQASNYDQSCTDSADCVRVDVGNACSCELSCRAKQDAINKGAEAQYAADVAGSPHTACGCPAFPPVLPGPCCVGGKCQLDDECPSLVDAGDAATDAGADANRE